MIRFNVIDFKKDIFEHGKRYDKELYRNFAKGVKKATTYLFRQTQKLVPVDTGKLKKSGKHKIIGSGRNTEGRIWYGTTYGVYVHEDLTKAHGAAYNRKYARQIRLGILKKKRPEEQAKFVEAPMASSEVRSQMFEIIVNNLIK